MSHSLLHIRSHSSNKSIEKFHNSDPACFPASPQLNNQAMKWVVDFRELQKVSDWESVGGGGLRQLSDHPTTVLLKYYQDSGLVMSSDDHQKYLVWFKLFLMFAMPMRFP